MRGGREFFAKGMKRRSIVGQMNALEQAYVDTWLEPALSSGRILWWRREGMRLPLAKDSTYVPDFNVLTADHFLEMHEIKGGYRTAQGMTKLKIAADIYPIRFLLVTRQAKKDGGAWVHEIVPGWEE